MAPKAHSKSAPATTPTDATTKSGDVKQPARFAPRIGEYVLRSSEVVKLSKTLQERIRTIAYAVEDYAKYNTDSKDCDRRNDFDLTIENLYAIIDKYSKDCDRRNDFDLWLAMSKSSDEVVKTVKDTFMAITGLYDVIKSPPPEFKKVAASLAAVVSIIKSLPKILNPRPERTLHICWRLLHAVNGRLDAAISELQWHLFSPVKPALSNDENSNSESSLANMHKNCVAEIDAQQRLVLDEVNRHGWQHALSLLQEKAPNAPEWEGITSDSDEFLIEEACSRYLERKAREQFNAKTEANISQLHDWIAMFPDTKQPVGLGITEPEWQQATNGAASIFAGAVIADKTIERITLAIIDKGKDTNEKLCAISKVVPIAPTLSAAALGKVLGVSDTMVKKTQWWKDSRKGEKTKKLAARKQQYADKTAAEKGAKFDAKRDWKDHEDG